MLRPLAVELREALFRLFSAAAARRRPPAVASRPSTGGWRKWLAGCRLAATDGGIGWRWSD